MTGIANVLLLLASGTILRFNGRLKPQKHHPGRAHWSWGPKRMFPRERGAPGVDALAASCEKSTNNWSYIWWLGSTEWSPLNVTSTHTKKIQTEMEKPGGNLASYLVALLQRSSCHRNQNLGAAEAQLNPRKP